MKKTVLITGCSTGFGLATAQLFASKDWNVVATMRSPEAGAELGALPGVLVTRLDVQDQASIDQAIGAGIERFGKIDALINNAGFGLFGVFEGTPREKIAEQFAVNVFGVMDVTRAILPHFRGNKAGLVINISSGAGVFTLPMLSLYAATKHALEGFSEGLSYELASQNIVVKIVEPGGVVSTSFIQRGGAESAHLTAIADYDAFVSGCQEVFAGLRGDRKATSADVAAAIYDAATDGTDRLRYVATADIAPLLAAKHDLSDPEYMAFMRARFMPRLPAGG